MILAFPAFRRGFFKIIGPVINEAIKRGHGVELIWKPEAKAGEAVRLVELEHWPTVGGVPDAIIGPTMHTHYPYRLAETRVVSLDYCWEQANAPKRDDLTQVWVTEYQKRLAGGQGPVLGSPQWDACSDARPMDLGSRPVLLVFSPKFRVGPGQWVYRWIKYRSVLARCARWASREGYRLVVKTRAKHGDPRYVGQYADALVYDGAVYPPTSWEAIKSATVAVHFQSGALLECAHAGVPSYSVRLPQPHLKNFRTAKEIYSGEKFSITHWPGVVQPLRGDPVPFEPQWHRPNYRSRYLGERGATGRVLDYVEAMVSSGTRTPLRRRRPRA